MALDSTSEWADIKKYEEILAKDPRSYCFAPLAERYRKLGLLDDAISIARKGCALHPEYAAGQMALGCALMDKGDPVSGCRALEVVVRITPDNLTAQKMLSQHYIDSADYAAAEKALAIILSLDPNDTESRLVLESLPKSSRPADDASPAIGSEETAATFAFAEDLSAADEIIELTDEILDEADEPAVGFATTMDAETSTGVPLATATMAELYVQQGFVRQAIGIYQELIGEDPANERFRVRLNQLVDQSAAVTPGAAAEVTVASVAGVAETTQQGQRGFLATLEQWLDNVRRVKECRSESA
jgi:tetratricopeptide (TPR) repeat protein